MIKIEEIKTVLSESLKVDRDNLHLFGNTIYGYYFRTLTKHGKLLINVDKESGHVFTKYSNVDEIYNYSGVTLETSLTFENNLAH